MNRKPRKLGLGILLVLLTSFLLNTWGLNWGLPSAERNRLYFDNREDIFRSLAETENTDVTKSMTEERELLSGSRFNPIRSYHPDESNFIKAVSNMDPKTFNLNPRYLYYGTLYIYLFALGLAVAFLFGFITLSTDITFYFLHPEEIARFYLVGRFTSAFFAVLSVYLTYLIGKKLYGPKVGLAAGLLMAICPMLVINAHYVSVDATMLFFVCLTFLFSISIMESGNLKWYLLAGASAGLAADTKYSAVLVLFVILLAHLLVAATKTGQFHRGFLRALFRRNILLAYLCAAATFLILCPYAIKNYPEFRSCQYGINAVLGQGITLPGLLKNIGYHLKALNYGIGLPFLLLSLTGMVIALKKKEPGGILITFWVIFCSGFFLWKNFFYDRYLMPILPFLAISAATVVFRPTRKKVVWKTAMALLLLPTLLYTLGYLRLFATENIRTTAGKWIAQNIKSGSVIGLKRDTFQFELPPINQQKYSVVITGQDLQTLKNKKPEYFLINEIEYRRNPSLWSEIFAKAGYQLEKEFFNPPKIFGIAFNENSPNEDYLYLYPRIFIYRHTDEY
ncbi:MAG: glycosyltransferase family 39 protein [Candidatus Omnitrophota bacterium]